MTSAAPVPGSSARQATPHSHRAPGGDALFRAAFEHAAAGMAMCDASGRWIRVNAALCVMTGFSADELLALGYRGITHPDDLADTGAAIKALVEGRVTAAQLDKRYMHRSGRILRVLVSIASVRDGSAPPWAFVTQIYDMTDRAAAEDALGQSVQRFGALAELAPAGIFQTDALGRTVYVNQRMCEITGRPAQEHMGDQWARAVHDDDRRRVVVEWQEAARAGAEYQGEYRVVNGEGETRWLICAARPLRGPGGVVQSFLGTVTDVTELKAAQERLKQSLEVQEIVRQREALLLRELNHRVRNNLAGLLGLLKIYERPERSGAEVAAAMRAMIRAMADVHDMISRAAGRPVLLADLIQRIAGPYRAAVEMEGPEVEVAPANAGSLAMVFQELFTNSAKHGALASATGRVRIGWERRLSGVLLEWVEAGGAVVVEPVHRGVGLSLVEGIARGDLLGEARFEFRTDGLSCILNLPLLEGSGPTAHDRTERARHDSHCR